MFFLGGNYFFLKEIGSENLEENSSSLKIVS